MHAAGLCRKTLHINGAHCCEVEVDPETGSVEIDRYIMVHDCGTPVNPMLVEAQLQGGVVHGLDQALSEHLVYDHDSGQVLSGSFLDYGLPADDAPAPAFVCELRPVPTATNPLGAKAVGEAGVAISPVVAVNAVLDALHPLGIGDFHADDARPSPRRCGAGAGLTIGRMATHRTGPMTGYNNDHIASLVRPDQVHRDVYEDPIYSILRWTGSSAGLGYMSVTRARSRNRAISSVPDRPQPVVVSRHSDGTVYVVYNRCAHRGVKVVNEECGNAGRFMCMYHGWTYDTNGDLDFVTQSEGYPDFEFDKVEHGMGRVARWESHQGFVFANLSPDGPGLHDWLGENRDFLDDIAVSAPDGEVEVTGGVHRYLYHGNWKMQVENLIDMYHPAYSHESSSAKGGQQFRPRATKGGIQFFEKRGKVKSMDGLGTHALPNGHTWQGGLPPVENTSERSPGLCVAAGRKARPG